LQGSASEKPVFGFCFTSAASWRKFFPKKPPSSFKGRSHELRTSFPLFPFFVANRESFPGSAQGLEGGINLVSPQIRSIFFHKGKEYRREFISDFWKTKTLARLGRGPGLFPQKPRVGGTPSLTTNPACPQGHPKGKQNAQGGLLGWGNVRCP